MPNLLIQTQKQIEMRKIIFTLLIAVIAVGSLSAQTLKQFQKKAQEAFNNQNYYAALTHYNTILEVKDNDPNILYNHAEAARNYNAYAAAEMSYEKVSVSEVSKTFPLTNYWLAGVKKNLGKYSESKELYTKFLNSSESQNEEFINKARQELEYLTWAEEAVNNADEGIDVQRMGDNVNTEYSESSPYEYKGKLYYSSLVMAEKDLDYYPYRPSAMIFKSSDAGVSATGEKISGLNTGRHAAHSSFNMAGDEIYYSQCNYVDDESLEIRCDIYVANVDTMGNFSKSRKLPDAINAPNFTNTQPHIALDKVTKRERLYFVSDRQGGLGGKDIWMADKTEGSYNDIDFSLNEDETKGYFASNRLGSNFIEEKREACCNDIYKVDLEPNLYDMRALTFDKASGLPLNGTTVELLEADASIESDMHADNNEFDYKVRKNKKYIIKASKPGYAPTEIEVTTDKIDLEDVVGKLYMEPYKLDLLALTYDAETTEMLKGVSIKMIDCDEITGDIDTNYETNEFSYENILPEKCYKLLVTRNGYVPQTVRIETDPLTGNKTIKEKIFLKKVPPVTRLTLEGYLPMPLYFDNDMPDKKSKKTVTNFNYIQTNIAYQSREPEFKKQAARGLKGEQKIQSEFEIEQFFSTNVSPAASQLVSFTDYLLRYLQQGNVAEIIIKGYASPLADSEYNLILTKRRISSIENHFSTYNGGVFMKYIQEGLLKVTEAPYGEQLSNSGVSDNPKDRKNSIYSVPASLERRVEIIELK